MKKINGFNTIRAISLLAVLFYHFSTTIFRGGYIFVNAFFMLSGFLITKKLLEEDSFSLLDFLKKKIQKLLPPVFFTIAISAILASIFARVLLSKLLLQSVTAMTFTNNIWQILDGQSYFEATYPLLFSHLWFLSVEFQILIFWPLVVSLVKRRPDFVKLLTFGVITILSMVVMAVLTNANGDNTLTYYHTISRLFAFSLGAFLSVFVKQSAPKMLLRNMPERNLRFVEGVLLLLTMFTAHFVRTDFPETFWFVMQLHTLLFFLIVFLAVSEKSSMGILGESKIINFLSDRSYEWYLLSFPLFQIVAVNVEKGLLVQILITVAIMIALTEAYRFFMNIFNPYQKRRTALVLAVLLIATFFVPVDRGDIDAMAEVAKEQEEALESQEPVTVEPVTFEPVTMEPTASAEVSLPENFGKLVLGENVLKMKPPAKEASLEDILASIKLSDEELAVFKDMPVTVIGDSVTLMCNASLKKVFPKLYNDSKKSRQFEKLPEQIRVNLSKKTLYPVVIIHLGVNGYIHEKHLREAIKLAGDRQLFFVANISPKSQNESHNNELLEQVADELPNVHFIRWYDYANGRNQIFYKDRVHPEMPKGTDVFAAFVARSLMVELKK
ncbi:acyltransferase family protein [Guggenheimella bovis]